MSSVLTQTETLSSRSDDASQEEVYLLKMQTEKEAAKQLSTMLEEAAFPQASAVSCFEGVNPGIWEVTAYYQGKAPHLRDIEKLAELFDCSLPDMNIKRLEQENWVKKGQQGLQPVSAGRFVIYGSHDANLIAHHPLSLLIDAGEAFGTAHHGTTRGCLELLDQTCKARYFDRVLDLGTGTGILAIACVKLQGGTVLASDIDPVSCRVASENARINGVGSQIKTQMGAGFVAFAKERDNESPYDLILANILAGPLAGMAQDFAEHTQVGSHIILSGILNEQARLVQARFHNANFAFKARREIEGWTSLVMVKQ